MTENFDVQNGTDGAKAQEQASQIKLPFDREDISGWIDRLEIRLEFATVKSQWLKRVCLENMLPADIYHCIKDLCAKRQTDAGNDIYLQCKKRLLKVHGKKPEDDFTEALKITLDGGPPSDAAKKIVAKICKKAKPLEDCCCGPICSKIWRDLLPPLVRAQVAPLNFTTQ